MPAIPSPRLDPYAALRHGAFRRFVAGGAGALVVVGLVARLSPALRRLGRVQDLAPVEP